MAFEPLTALLDVSGKVIDRLFPDPTQRAAAQQKLTELAQSGELETLRIELADTDSARKREMEVKDRMPATLALLSLVLFAAALWALLSGNVDKSNAEVVYLLLGTLNGIVGTVFAYYFGTTRSSQQKNSILSEALRK